MKKTTFCKPVGVVLLHLFTTDLSQLLHASSIFPLLQNVIYGSTYVGVECFVKLAENLGFQNEVRNNIVEGLWICICEDIISNGVSWITLIPIGFPLLKIVFVVFTVFGEINRSAALLHL